MRFMNMREMDILQILFQESFISQRALAGISGYSLGAVNQSLSNLIQDGYLNDGMRVTSKAREEFRSSKPRNAIILAAGLGMRMVPVNLQVTKGLIEIKGEVLVERLIKQLHEVDIQEIYIVVGFMKEQYEYLIDEYKVRLIVNPDYAVKNNLHSLKLVLDQLSNTYILPCDIWCEMNPFCKYELHSWYMVSDLVDDDSEVRVTRKRELVRVKKAVGGNAMIGIAYLTAKDCEMLKSNIRELCQDKRYNNDFWEAALYFNGEMFIPAKLISSGHVVEVNTYEQLRDMDGASNHLKSDALDCIAEVFGVHANAVTDISVLKKGMTNRSFLFSCQGNQYIMRIPGEGTQRLINRKQEAQVYSVIAGKGLCDDVLYINPETGYKITKYLKGARVCNPHDSSDLEKCMRKLRTFHNMHLEVEHVFDIFGQIEFYQRLWQGNPSIYRDYLKTKQNVMSLKSYIDLHGCPFCLTHIDAVPDNFLFYENESGDEELQLMDWEYAGMQDPHVDVAMFCIYSLYQREQVDQLIDIYFENQCERVTRIKIYCYIAACGLLWSNWCEYKRNLGVDFGEYSLRQYRYAKEYYQIVINELETCNE